MNNKMDWMSVNVIRVLSADAIEKAKSGHPGLPLGMAPACYELWAHHMSFNSKDPKWDNRDRFILSGGHGSMLLYSLLHLFGYGLTRGDLMQFRQFGSKTPGHPEYGHTAGVEATTGPLGAGIGMAVGMAAAEKHLAAIFNRPGYPVVDHRTYVECGDGDLMEGISSEALSLAGTWNLSKLTVLYDRNHISIEGGTDLAFTEDVEKRVQAFGFKTLTVEDGNDLEAMVEAAASCSHPTAIRYPRGNCRIDPEEHRVYSGGNVRIRSGKDGDLWAVGAMLDTGREVCRILEEQGISLGLVSVKSVKPLDLSLLPRNTKRIYTLEDGVLTGGYGQYMKAHTPAFWQVTGFGWPDRFIEQGAPADLYQKYGLDAAGVAERIREDNRKED